MQSSNTPHLSSMTYKKAIPECTLEQNFHPKLKTRHNKMSAMYAPVCSLFDTIFALSIY